MRIAAPFTRAGIRRGFVLAQPLGFGIFVYGVVFGVLAAAARLSALEALLMSAAVYSGSAQLAALQSWSGAALVAPVVMAILLMNARYVLYGAALRPWLGGLGPMRTYPALFFLGDGNWALSMKERAAGQDDAGFVLGSGVAMFLPWCLGTLAGHLGGGLVADAAAFGLDFMLVAFSAAFAVAMWRGRADIACAGVAAIVAVALSFVAATGWVIVAAGIASALMGYLGHDDRA
jgi:predicted branched-subunit amino acid permease